MKKLAVVPIYWGSKWLPPTGVMQPLRPEEAITWIHMNSAMWTIMRSWYMLGLADYGVEPGLVHPGYVIRETEDSPPPPPTFESLQCWRKINDVIAGGLVPQPDAWGDDYKVLYSLFLQPGSRFTNPNRFGENLKKEVYCWVTANSDLPGVIEFYAHEMLEASSNEEMADPCQPETVVIDGLRLPTYKSKTLNTCWPTREAVLAHRGFLNLEGFKDLKDIHVHASP